MIEEIGGITSMEFIHKAPSVEAYNKLRVNSGMNSTKPNSEVKKALEGTLSLFLYMRIMNLLD